MKIQFENDSYGRNSYLPAHRLIIYVYDNDDDDDDDDDDDEKKSNGSFSAHILFFILFFVYMSVRLHCLIESNSMLK